MVLENTYYTDLKEYNMFDFTRISQEFIRIKASPQWHDLIDKFKDATDIGYIGHGGNLAVADHAAMALTYDIVEAGGSICPLIPT